MRLVTRGDLDGLACAHILAQHESIDDMILVHPQQITDKEVRITSDDILANLPYHPDCGMWFDHHLLTDSNERPPADFEGLYREAPSAAQLVWEHYGEEERFSELVRETNRFDSAQLTEDDVLQPRDYVLLGFILDPRTGLGNDEKFFFQCLEWLASKSIRELLVEPVARERIIRMFDQNEHFCWMLVQYSRLNANVVFTDFRRVTEPPVGNRFLVYTLFPEANVSVRAHWGDGKESVMVTAGHSIFDRSCKTSIGALMSEYGGGGHRGAGSSPLPVMGADPKILEIIGTLQQNG